MSKKHTRRNKGRLGTLAEARTGLTRATLLFGSIAAALILIVVPDSVRRDRDDADHAVVDRTLTGSIGTPAQTFAARADNTGPCLMFPDGTQRGACR